MTTVTVHRRALDVAPRKVRLIVNAIRSKNALSALSELAFMEQSAAKHVALLLKSGIAAAKQKDLKEDQLVVTTAFANEGRSLKRRRLRNRGQSTVIKKTYSHVTLGLSEVAKKPVSKELAKGKE